MFEKPFLCIALLFVSLSLVVAGSNIEQSLVSRKKLVKSSECFPEFSEKQGETVQKLGDTRDACVSSEASAKANLQIDLSNFSYEMAKLADGFCVRIDNDCRDKYAQDDNVTAALECYSRMAFEGRLTMQNLQQQTSRKLITADIEELTIVATRKNCTTQANFEYLRTSDSLFEQFVLCEDGDGHSSSTSTPEESTTQPDTTTSELGENEPPSARKLLLNL